MPELHKYQIDPNLTVVAVQLNLETEGLRYRKWGGDQMAKAGDWLVDNGTSVYTIDRESFAHTYARVSRGIYRKTTVVWAHVAEQAGSIATKEGVSHYDAGDYVVYNEPLEDGDVYMIRREQFEARYRRIEGSAGVPAPPRRSVPG